MESVLADLVLKGALEDILDRNIAKWAQSSPFTNVFARRKLTSTQLVRPAAKFILEDFEEQYGKVEQNKKIAEVPLSLPPSTPSSWKASAEL